MSVRRKDFALECLPISRAHDDSLVRPSRFSLGRDAMSTLKLARGRPRPWIARRRPGVLDSRLVPVRATISAQDENTMSRVEVEEMIVRENMALEGGDGVEDLRMDIEFAIAKEESSGEGGKSSGDGLEKIRSELESVIAKKEEGHGGESRDGSDAVVLPSENGELHSFSSTFGGGSKFGNSEAKTAKPSKFGGGPDDEIFSTTSEPEFSTGSRSRRRRQLPTVVQSIGIDELLQKAISGNQSLPNFICDAADSFITSFLNPLSSHKEYVDAAAVLGGLFAPVPETPPTKCRVLHGNIPPDLAGGVYLRNGPNATAIHEGDGYHVFDGDGMLHAVKIPADGGDGVPVYCSRFVQTSRFRQEKEAGKPLMGKFFGGTVGAAGVARMAVTMLRSVVGVLDIRNGFGLSNTNVCYFNGRILSLSEDDLPYIIRLSDDGDLSTVGRFALPPKTNMCAHPKFDPITGEMYAFSLNIPLPLPPFSFFRLSADGTKSGDVPVPLLDVPLVHDFAITARFVIFPDNQLVIRPWAMLNGEMPLVAEAGKMPRLGLLPRYALPEEGPAAAMWFEAPGVNCMHYVNAWEEGRDEVVIVASVLSPLDQALELNCSSTLTRIRINTKTGKVSTRPICAAGSEDLELGVINPNFTGKKTRYAYLATGIFPHLTGVVKVDVSQPPESAVVAKRDFAGEGFYGGEPCFVPAKEAVSEDDGYLLCVVGDEKKDVSHLLIMDAQSSSLRVMAAVELPSRVPAGFHGCFVTAEQLAKQRD